MKAAGASIGGRWWSPGRTTACPPWMAAAKEHKGSWWPDWDKWVKKHAGGKDVPARQPGSGKLKVLCDAPGTYVKVRSG